MEQQFNLIYYHRTTGEAYRARRITLHDYVIEYPDTKECIRISKWKLDKCWKASKENKKKQRKHRINFENEKTG